MQLYLFSIAKNFVEKSITLVCLTKFQSDKFLFYLYKSVTKCWIEHCFLVLAGGLECYISFTG